MLEGWEWIVIFGFVALTMVIVLVVALLYFLTKKKYTPSICTTTIFTATTVAIQLSC